MIKMVLNETDLTNLITKIEGLKDKTINEQNTKAILIEPLLSLLGWNISDVEEIYREYPTSSKKPVDYKLQVNDHVLYLEAKRLKYKLSSEFQRQITTYAFHDNIPFCVLTNGKKYQIFETLKSTPDLSEKLILEIDLTDKEKSIKSKVAALNFLSRENVSKGNLKEINKYLTLRIKVVAYLQQLLSTPNKSFIKLIAKNINVENKEEEIKQAIISYREKLENQNIDDIENISIKERILTKKEEINLNDLMSKLKSKELQNIFLQLREKILKLGDDISQVLYMQYNYLTFKRDTEFATMKVKPINEEIEVFLKFGEFKPEMNGVEKLYIEPIPKTTRWGRVNYRMKINNEDQIIDAMKLIRQCYKHQLNWRK